MGLISLCLYADLIQVKIDKINFTVYQQNEPKQVVFLIGGDSTDDSWWFKDTTILNKYRDTLFVGVGQSYTLKEDLEKIITWVKSEYDFPDRNQWSFLGFSLGAYETFNTAMAYHHDTFGNYCAIGGGDKTNLDTDPKINLLYIIYGEYDMDTASVYSALEDIRNKGFVNPHNLKVRIIQGEGHNLSEAREGLDTFLAELDNLDKEVRSYGKVWMQGKEEKVIDRIMESIPTLKAVNANNLKGNK